MLGRKVTADVAGGILTGTVSASWLSCGGDNSVDAETVLQVRTQDGREFEALARCCRIIG